MHYLIYSLTRSSNIDTVVTTVRVLDGVSRLVAGGGGTGPRALARELERGQKRRCGRGKGQATRWPRPTGRSPGPSPRPRRPLLLGWQRLPRAWKRSRVSLARRAGFVNKHWGGRRRPRSRWLRSCPPGRSLLLAATPTRPPAHARGPAAPPGARGAVDSVPSPSEKKLKPGACGMLMLFISFVRWFVHSSKIYSII